jgi:glycosyltransferase involved in cell wall biosynthesis
MTNDVIRILELRSATGSGGGPEKTILLGAARGDRQRFAVTVCYIRDQRDAAFDVARRAGDLGVDCVEIVERHSLIRRSSQPSGGWSANGESTSSIRTNTRPTYWRCSWRARPGPFRWRPCTDGPATAGASGASTTRSTSLLRTFPLSIAVSSEIRSELVRCGVPPDRVRVVLNGIDPEAFRRNRGTEGDIRRALAVAPDEIVVGAIGRLEPQKRFDLLIRACAALRQLRPALRLLIAGDGSQRAALQTLADELMPGGACRLLGHRPDVTTIHHGFDVFAQSSDYEGTPNAVLEAMAMETPLVATAAGGTAEIVEDRVHGLIVSCGDVDGLTDAIERTLCEPVQTSRRVARARRRVEPTLSCDARVAAVERIYAELAVRFRRPAVGHLTERSA